jgi:hypothetical protein
MKTITHFKGHHCPETAMKFLRQMFTSPHRLEHICKYIVVLPSATVLRKYYQLSLVTYKMAHEMIQYFI